MNIDVNLILLVLTALAALATVMMRSLLRAAIGLALTSILVTLVLFNLGAPLAAVFELSVCAGLITVVFISTIALVKHRTHAELVEHKKERIKRFWFLPVIMVLAAAALALRFVPFNGPAHLPFPGTDTRSILWESRQLDLVGQILMLLTGFFSVVVLFKEKLKEKKEI